MTKPKAEISTNFLSEVNSQREDVSLRNEVDVIHQVLSDIASKEGIQLSQLKMEIIARKRDNVSEFAAIKAFTLLYLSHGE